MQAGLLIAGRSGSCFVQDNGVLTVIAEIVGVDKLGAWPSEAHPHLRRDMNHRSASRRAWSTRKPPPQSCQKLK